MPLRRVENRRAFDAVWPILAESVFEPTAARREALGRAYLERGPRCLWAFDVDGRAVAVVGVRLDGAGGEITHLAVAARHRGEGLGRAALEALRLAAPAVRVWRAETDDEAVGFYRRLGFAVEDLGERYPGVRRYRCTLERPSATRRRDP